MLGPDSVAHFVDNLLIFHVSPSLIGLLCGTVRGIMVVIKAFALKALIAGSIRQTC